MTKNGEFLLLKREKIFYALSAAVLVIAAGICSFGCKSTPFVENEVDPLDLIDSRSAFYIRIPKEVDSALIARMLQNNLQGLSENDARKVAERIDTVYLGLKKTRKSVEFQIASRCSFPKIAVSSAFSKKNGWTSDKLVLNNAENREIPYTVYSNSGILAAFPSENIALLGVNVPSMVERFHNISQKIEFSDDLLLGEDIKTWLSYEDGIRDGQIRFYASKPQSFLTTLIGANLNFKLVYVKGFLENDFSNENQYLAELEFEFREPRVVGAAQAMLEVAFGLTDSNVKKTSETHLVVSGIEINKRQLYKILVL